MTSVISFFPIYIKPKQVKQKKEREKHLENTN